jgi:hypothetical protein
MDVSEADGAWAAHGAMAALGRDLMGGTWRMRRMGQKYLPPKLSEKPEEYARRLAGACLDNFFHRTITYYLGQVFQKDINVKAPVPGEKVPYDAGFFEAFKEDVNLSGESLNTFSKKVFKDGLVNGVSFVLVDYTRADVRESAEGFLEYLDASGAWLPKTPEADARIGARPYLIHVKAEQVLDAWTVSENGRTELRHFRYSEASEVAVDERCLDRRPITRIICWWPDRWEIWTVDGGPSALTASGRNFLGRIPLAVFMPGEQLDGLTAMPPLADLAELNRVYWAAAADHDMRLMPFVRSPVLFGRKLGVKEGAEIPVSPGRLINAEADGADLRSVGIDSGSASHSELDLREKRESMREFGLQATQAHVTATQSENSASTAAASLKGWVAQFKDCLENAFRLAANWMGWEDGPAAEINTRFRYGFDLNLLNLILRAMMPNGPLRPEHFAAQYHMMAPNSDDLSFEDVYDPEYVKSLQETAETEYQEPGRPPVYVSQQRQVKRDVREETPARETRQVI